MNFDSMVGHRLNKRRQELNISLRKLAQMTDLTASFLSQVERGKANLSLNSLHRIAQALNVPLLYFLEETAHKASEPHIPQTNGKPADETLSYSPVITRSERPKLILPLSGVQYELLTPSVGRKMVALSGRLSPGSDNIARRLHEPTEEIIYVLQGSLLIGLDSGEYILNAHDTIYFEGRSLQKIICASTDEDAVWVSVITPAVF
ncbi:MAG: helix-turn-helix transcriptional regulator [Anaerolineae bacterium]|nr:helix-turn-helix transcriptional regulator [Anaerolineae bacterium]